MSESPEVLVFGSAIIDFICYTPRLPKAGETLHGHKFQTGFGGKGANQCVAAARLGSHTALIAKLGDDSFGQDYLRQLRAEYVNVEHVQPLPNQTTGIAQIAVSDEGENNIIIVVGANNALNASDVTAAAQFFDQAKVLVCQLETPIEATLHALRQFKGISIVNAAPALEETPGELLQLSTILCVNETEAALMTGMQSINSVGEANAAVERLIEMGANGVIITLGKLGAVCGTKQTQCEHVPAPHVPPEKVVDTTGAGDAFIGALAHNLARYPKEALTVHIAAACQVASKSVQLPGTQASFPFGGDL
ncbi:ribokinase [Drosophila grimshawi]|uniref:Ribokinase n=1 Tax=Drosophila grimshawi TaxID=7222 RepID=B4JK94_DROGR|nr:ribokinase [Drosophila grimshawi]EDV99996.1 GH12089 [Drosophila grimshawi]